MIVCQTMEINIQQLSEQQIEAVQRKAVRFLKNIKGRTDSAAEIYDMKSMSTIRQACRVSFSFYS